MILVTGGLGVMGTTLVQGLLKQGEKVRVLDIPGHPHKERLAGFDVEVMFGDVQNPEDVEKAMQGVDTVFHLAAVLISKDPSVFRKVNVEGTRNLVQSAARQKVEHFIFVSSISVTYPYTTPYSISKRDCEQIVRSPDHGMKWTIIRPSLAYNSYGGQEFMMFLQYLKRFPIVPFIGSGKALKNPVHVDDLMKGFLAVPHNEKAFNKVYNFCGSEEISIWNLAKLMLRHQGIRKPFLAIPIPLAKLAALFMALCMEAPPLTRNAIAGITQNANPDWSETQKDLNYHPIGITEGMEKAFPLSRLK